MNKHYNYRARDVNEDKLRDGKKERVGTVGHALRGRHGMDIISHNIRGHCYQVGEESLIN